MRIGWHIRRLDDRAFSITGSRTGTQACCEQIRLAPFQEIASDLGGLTQAQRQHAGRQRIEAAGMTALDTAEGIADALQRGVGGQT